MDDRTKLWGTCFMSCQAFCMISKPPVKFQTGVTVRKRSIRVKLGDIFISCVTFKFYRWHWKTIRHLFHATSSFVYHFIAIAQFKRKLQFGNDQCGSKSTMFCLVRPWNLTDDREKQKGISSSFVLHLQFYSYSPETPNLGKSRRVTLNVPCDLEIWWITLKNNRAPLRCNFKLCHWWIQTGVIVQKLPNWGKICFIVCDLDLWHLTLTFCMVIILSMVITFENFAITSRNYFYVKWWYLVIRMTKITFRVKPY